MDAPLNTRTYPRAPAYPALPDYYSAAYLQVDMPLLRLETTVVLTDDKRKALLGVAVKNRS